MLYPNQYIHRIDKEEVNRLPLARFTGEVIIVNTVDAMTDAVQYLNRYTCVGVDTETRPSFQHGQHFPTALLQIATTERCYLFQLKQTGFTRELADIFSNPAICKVGLAFHDDLNGLKRLRPFVPQNCVDLQKIVLKYGILDLGLQKIFAIVFSQKINKSQQLTNWENPVLTDLQAQYAATDAWATLLIYKRLKRTHKLPRVVYQQLREEDLLRQQLHQQEMMAQRLARNEENLSQEA